MDVGIVIIIRREHGLRVGIKHVQVVLFIKAIGEKKMIEISIDDFIKDPDYHERGQFDKYLDVHKTILRTLNRKEFRRFKEVNKEKVMTSTPFGFKMRIQPVIYIKNPVLFIELFNELKNIKKKEIIRFKEIKKEKVLASTPFNELKNIKKKEFIKSKPIYKAITDTTLKNSKYYMECLSIHGNCSKCHYNNYLSKADDLKCHTWETLNDKYVGNLNEVEIPKTINPPSKEIYKLLNAITV
jgi:hypothetical protein